MLGMKQRRKIDLTNKKELVYKFIILNKKINLFSAYKKIPNKM